MSLVGFKAGNHPQQTERRGARDDVDDRGTTAEVFGPLDERFGFTLDVAAAPHNAKCEAYYTIRDDGLTMPWGEARWAGGACLMCNGSGKDYASVTEQSDIHPWSTVVGYVELDSPCRACNGHGREPTLTGRPAERVWCNPPYSDCGAWVRKAWDEWRGEHPPEVIVMLLPANRVEQGWWQDHVEPFRDRPDSPLRVEFLRGRLRFDRPGWVPGPKGDRPTFGCCLLIWSTQAS